MARSGINKTLVKHARDAVIAKGENPSIDRVRIELGNTGSKATIHRYLKELNADNTTKLGNETALSETIKEFIGTLAIQIQREAQEIVSKLEKGHSEKQTEWEKETKQLKNDNKLAENKLSNVTKKLADTSEENAQLITTIQNHKTQEERKTEEINGLKRIINEKEQQIESLEEKHNHHRESLKHYRESVKNQRDVDLRRHDQQTQQLQTEMRQLNQSLSIKQNDITQLNRDNSRLVTELSDSQKSNAALSNKVDSMQIELSEMTKKNKNLDKKLEQLNIALKECEKERGASEKQLTKYNAQKFRFEAKISKLQIELEVKDKLLEKLGIAD